MSLSIEAVLEIVGLSLALRIAFVITIPLYNSVVRPRLPPAVAYTLATLQYCGSQLNGITESGIPNQTERLLEDDLAESALPANGLPDGGFPQSQRFHALAREVIVREYETAQTSAW
ncbi:uncharacterized protein K489DRAFT_407841 [Dissoconium aciculare CBS 342.82]|uniref:Uncharacterized protein n=1 Tax=Dissoconium aciculare CBS 342.82 TaxID=1314786 RepID=A0A6J3ME69_9PEZI|nr:uncharacterized protein K489DRAFT_407841 [Dissoconium aciculare CBS 342.82]KAF1825147.1 hypothetical protein K489DRAFT_407841 [Dissoconium aciculare CBS 342.82]